ncbi:MAG: phosphosulfolactate synthase [Betaproteobacteria bacterium]|nr:phosphosulfolactate synthase [Betaproteobacteria bacterium]MBI3937099.1 phosphosulfolactate synthase [Betaproteobacteria bacterium]
MEQTLQQYLGIRWPERSVKPRKQGLTMVMDTGWPVSFVESMLAQYGEYLDVVKIWDPHLRAPEREVRRKIEVYNAHAVRVQPGGIFMEIARIQGAENEVMRKLAAIGFSVIEVSSTATSAERDMRKEADFVKRAKDLGFTVFGEVGKKFADQDETRRSEEVVDEEVTVKEMLALFEAGAEHVYWEGHLLRRVMGETAEELLRKREAGTQQVLRVAKEVGAGRIIFEVSPLRPVLNRRALQFWLVALFGTEVNIGNARLEELGYLEALRCGSHPVHGFKQAGDYPWIRAVETGKGEDYPWWAEALSV